MCRCCGQAEVERLTAALADRDQRIEAVERVIEEHGWIEFDLIREALRGGETDV